MPNLSIFEKTRLPEGVKDFLPGSARRIAYLEQILAGVYVQYSRFFFALAGEITVKTAENNTILVCEQGQGSGRALDLVRALRGYGYAVALEIVSRTMNEILACAQLQDWAMVLALDATGKKVKIHRLEENREEEIPLWEMFAPEFKLDQIRRD